MTTGTVVEQEPAAGSAGTVTDEQLISMLVDRARGEGLKLTGEGVLLQQRVLESALDGEITDHVGYASTTRRARAAGTPGRSQPSASTDSTASPGGSRPYGRQDVAPVVARPLDYWNRPPARPLHRRRHASLGWCADTLVVAYAFAMRVYRRKIT